jgi:membrane associated rhomboid family serine protease
VHVSPEDEKPGALDRVVDFAAKTLDALGLNGTRLRWRWNRHRAHLAEAGARSDMLVRSARAKHKMCPACRTLVPRSATRCEACDADLASVRRPGFGRVVANLLPGMTAATSLLLLTNGFWFLLTLLAQIQGGGDAGLFSPFEGRLLYEFGSGYSPATLAGEWWRIITPIFLHGGILHFFFNSYVLVQLGPLVEEEFGTERFWVIYLLSGICGSALSQFMRPVNTVGASGAIFGLIGLLLVHGWRTGGSRGTAIRTGMMRYLVYVLIFSLLAGSGIDHLNHAGGFACGALLGLVVRAGAYRGKSDAIAWSGMAVLGVLLVMWSFYRVAVPALT